METQASWDTARAIRQRDNKRRHRNRQKEYVADLERRLEEARQRGVQATKEVQAAAKQTAWENRRLRKILQDQGLDNDVINSLIYGEVRCRGKASPPSTEARAIHPERQDNDEITKLNRDPTNTESRRAPCNDNDREKSNALCTTSQQMCTKTAPASAGDTRVPPCKLLTILADNPNADVTQPPSQVEAPDGCARADGVECVQAREMLMRFATNESKFDEVARALEKGCVKNESSKGCRVKNDVVWATLDRMLE